MFNNHVFDHYAGIISEVVIRVLGVEQEHLSEKWPPEGVSEKRVVSNHMFSENNGLQSAFNNGFFPKRAFCKRVGVELALSKGSGWGVQSLKSDTGVWSLG